MSDHDLIRRGDAYGEFPDDWRDRAHGFKGTFKMQAAWSDGFNACRKSIAALPAVDVAEVCEEAVQAEREEIADLLEIIFAASDGIELRLGGTSETITLIEIVATIRALKGGAAGVRVEKEGGE
jgi:hypothetical protein